jgi:hypothetical protein
MMTLLKILRHDQVPFESKYQVSAIPIQPSPNVQYWQMTRAYRYILQAKMRTLMINARVISIMQYLIVQLSAYLHLLRQ